MQIEILNSFIKDIKKLKDASLKRHIKQLVDDIESAENISDINNIKKLTGHKKFYRIRLKNYRIGLYIEDNIIYLVRFLHRKEVYKFFP